jgi:dihydroxyacetone kinase
METIDSTLRVLPDTQVLALTQPSSRVALICGGGSGHEPAHSGFVHEDLLTASVNGHIFASPPSSYVLKAIEYVNQLNSGKGVIVIVKNYTGDVLNFGLAIQ